MDVTLTFQTRNRFKEFNAALTTLNQAFKGEPPLFSVVVIDDASDYHELVQKRESVKRYANVRMIENIRKSSMAQLYNQGILAAPTRYVILCNDDVTFKPGFITRIWHDIEDKAEVSWYFGSACFLIDKAIIPFTGWVGDERYKHWFYEDTDWDLRTRNPEVKVLWHKEKAFVHHLHLQHKKTGNENFKPGRRINYEIFCELWGLDPLPPEPEDDWIIQVGRLCEDQPKVWEEKIGGEIDWYPAETSKILEMYPREAR